MFWDKVYKYSRGIFIASVGILLLSVLTFYSLPNNTDYSKIPFLNALVNFYHAFDGIDGFISLISGFITLFVWIGKSNS